MRIAITPVDAGLILPAQKSHSIARIIEMLIRGLKERGHEVILLAPSDCKVDCELIPICDKHLPLHEDRGLIYTMQVQQRILQELRRIAHRIDIVNAHSFDIPGYFYGTRLLQGVEFPNVTTCHSCIEITNIEYFKTCNNNIISLSYNQREAFPSMQFAGNAYNGLDPAPFTFVEQPDNYLCFLGRMSSVKQPHLAIQLAIQLGLKLKMAGPICDPVDKLYFDEYCVPYLTHPLIEYLGELDMNEKIELISHARCNLHPTGFRDPCPLVPIEAAYCGTPTLAICRGALPELIQDGLTGKLVEDFAEGFHKIHECFSMSRSYIAQRSRELFNYRNMTSQYLSIYREVIGALSA
jgi:glycosyltransferase involved in cell wall biosynthesis